MFGGGGIVISQASEDAVRSLIELVTHPAKAKEALDHFAAERKKMEKQLAEMRVLNDNIVKQQAEAQKALEEADKLKTEYETKLLAFEEREKNLREGFASLELRRAEVHAQAVAAKAAAEQRERNIAVREQDIAKMDRTAADKLLEAERRLTDVDRREAKLRALRDAVE
jgi:hypothetical protein